MPARTGINIVKPINYIDDLASYRHLLAAVMHRAWRDAMGQIESGCKGKDMIMLDAAQYFEGEVFKWHAELLGIDPALRPDWGGAR